MMERDIRAFLQAITESANYSVIHKVLHPLVMNRNSQSKIFPLFVLLLLFQTFEFPKELTSTSKSSKIIRIDYISIYSR